MAAFRRSSAISFPEAVPAGVLLQNVSSHPSHQDRSCAVIAFAGAAMACFACGSQEDTSAGESGLIAGRPRNS